MPLSTEPAPLSRLDVGRASITFLPDGFHHVPAREMYAGTADSAWAKHGLDRETTLVMSVGAFLVEVAGRKSLVDLGLGPISFDMAAASDGLHEGYMEGGSLLDSLAATGTAPGDISAVFFTHLHMDHLGWLCSDDGEPHFPNALLHLTKPEWEFWTDGPMAEHFIAPSAQKKDVLRSGLRFVEDGEQAVEGVRLLATPGHTPGHASYVVESEGHQAVIVGDAMHNPFEVDPYIVFAHDGDKTLAASQRKRLADLGAVPKSVLGGCHFPGDAFLNLSS